MICEKIDNSLMQMQARFSSASRRHFLSPRRSNGRLLRRCVGSVDDWYSTSPPPLKRTIKDVEVKSLEGKGRGVVATADLAPGDLIMLCEPLVFMRGVDGQRPDAEGLVDMALEQGTYSGRCAAEHRYDGDGFIFLIPPAFRRWFRDFLYDGSERSTSSLPEFTNVQSFDDSASVTVEGGTAHKTSPSAEAVAKRLSGGKAGFGKTGKSAGKPKASADPSFPGGVDRATAKRTAKVVKFNCFGEPADLSC